VKKNIKMGGLPFNSLGINLEIFHFFKKITTMKKLFLVLAVASLGFVSCNNESETTTTDDTTNVDTTVVAPPVVTPDTTVVTGDTLVKKDTLKK
jgi:hypothetical protein